MDRRSSPHRRSSFAFLFAAVGSLAVGRELAAQVATVDHQQKISESQGGFGFTGLDPVDVFGSSLANLGDLDGNGAPDLAVGAPRDDDGGIDQGAVWILFLGVDGRVASRSKISETSGGFGGVLADGERFGTSVAAAGDIDGDGIGDLVVGASDALWIVFLNLDGTVKGQRGTHTAVSEAFGSAVAALGDLDGDGVPDIAVGAVREHFGDGAVWILHLRHDGSVRSAQQISEGAGGFGGVLDYADNFGCSVASLGDLDGDGVSDLAVGANGDDDGGNALGAVWVLLMNTDGTVKAEQRISATSGEFGGYFGSTSFESFGGSLVAADLDGQGPLELLVGATGDDDGPDAGAVWALFLDIDGTVIKERKISATSGGFGGQLEAGDQFGAALANLGDVDGNGAVDVVVGAPGDDDRGDAQGAVWVLFLNGRRQRPELLPGLPIGPHIVGPRLLVVDDDPSDCALSNDIQVAVNAAADGDVVLVRDGSYPPVTIQDKSVRIIAEGDVHVSRLEVRDLDEDRDVVVRGLGAHFDLHDNAGAIWIEDCSLGGDTFTNCAQIGLFRSTVSGYTHGLGFCPDGGSALEIVGSTLFAYDTDFTGSGGCDASYFDDNCDDAFCGENPATSGANGLGLSASDAFLFRCVLRGGNGGDGASYTGSCELCSNSIPGASGGSGISLPSDSELVYLETGFHAGTGSPPGDTIDGPGNRTQLSARSCDFSVGTPLVHGLPASVEFTGTPGNAVFVTYSTEFSPQFLPERSGYSVVDPASTTDAAGTLPGSGVLQLSLPIDVLAGLQRAGVLFTQSKVYDPTTDTPALGAPSVFLQFRDPCP